jgi:hypothetical protein
MVRWADAGLALAKQHFVDQLLVSAAKAGLEAIKCVNGQAPMGRQFQCA